MSAIEQGTTTGRDDAAIEELHEIVGRQRAAFLAEPFPSLEERQSSHSRCCWSSDFRASCSCFESG